MFGHEFPVHADVESVEMSAHADRSELMDWLATADSPGLVLVNHGELEASESLAAEIWHRFRLPSQVPSPGQRVTVPSHAVIGDTRT
jgi:predicted metal-dependent RNase